MSGAIVVLATNVGGTFDCASFTITINAAPTMFSAQTPPGGLPQAGETLVTFTNNHWQYALTWYGIGLGLAVLLTIMVVAQLRAKHPRDHPSP